MDKADRILELLETLFSAFPTTTNTNPTMTARTYLQVLEPHSLDAIERSVNQFLRGAVDGHEGTYAPSAAVLARNVRSWDEAIASVTKARTAAIDAHMGIKAYPIGGQPPEGFKPLGPILDADPFADNGLGSAAQTVIARVKLDG